MEKRIPPKLLKSLEREMNAAGENLVQEGYILYDKGGILTLDFLDGQSFEAAVEDDSHLYNVSIMVDKSHKICDYTCECRHGFNRFCRHITAVMAAIRDGNYRENTPIVPADYHENIVHADETRLRQFITDYMEQDPAFRNRLLTVLGILPEEQIFDETRRQLDQWTQNYLTAGYRSAETMGSMLRKFMKNTLDDTEEYQKNGYDVLAFKTSVYLIRSAALVVYSMYKGQNEVFGYINHALELCEKCADRIMESGNEENQRTICRYGLLQIGYCQEWCEPLLKLLFPVANCRMPVQFDKKVEHLAEEKTLSLEFWLDYLRTLKGEEAYEKYLTDHAANDTIRRILIQLVTERGDYEKAAQLCLERIQKERSPQNRTEWMEMLFDIYKNEQNIHGMTETAKQLLYLEKDSYYDLLKELLMKSGEWENVYLGLMEEFSRKLSAGRFEKILLKEKEYRLLLDQIETGDGYAIFEYGSQIAEEYPDEVTMVYRAKLEEMAESAGKRDEYQEICRHLKELADFGGTEVLRGMIADFYVRYKRRIAFMEELRKIEKELGLDGTVGYT